MKGGEVGTKKHTFTVDKNNHILLCTRLRRVLLILKAQNVFSLILLVLLKGAG